LAWWVLLTCQVNIRLLFWF